MRPFLNLLSKMDFCTFLVHFGALNATICTSVLHISSTIEKYGVSAFTGKKINVSRPKLISNDKNEVWEHFKFFFKKLSFFQILRICRKKQLQELFFFENFIQLQNTLESLQIIFRTCWSYRWKAHASHSTILRL